MEKSSFFNAVIDQNGTPDRSYLAEDFAKYFSTFIGNGVFPNPANQLQVIAIDNNMQIRIKAGFAWINGYMYENTDDYIFKLDPADGVLNRIDRVVLRLDFLERKIKAVVKKGEYGSTPVASALQRDADAYEIALADIYVRAGAISITQSSITDTRLNKELCGIVHGVVDQVDPTAIFNQFQAWYSETKEVYDKDISKWTKEKKEAFDKWYADNTKTFLDKFNKWYEDNTEQWENEFSSWFKNTEVWTSEFNNWFGAIKNVLDGDIAAKLTVKTIELEEKINTLSGASGEKEKLNKDNFEEFKKETENKLNGIAAGAEVNQNAISSINVDDKFITASKKEDSIELKLDKNLKTNVTSNVITITKRIKTDGRLYLMVDKTTGVDDYNENTPFKTIQAALDYIKTYYSGLEEGCLIKITPGEYDYFTINNFNVNYGVIELESSEAFKIPSKGTLDESYTVNLMQFKIHNNATRIILRGFSIRGLEPKKMILGTDGEYPYVTLFDILINANVLLHKCNIYGSSGNFAGWKWYYGFRPYCSKVLVRDCKLGQFTSSVAGGNSAPIRVVDNSDVVLLFDKFEGNSSYDIIAEESRIHIRNCSRTDGKPLKKLISAACLIAEQ